MDPRIDLLLALGDDELVMGHRHSLWTGVAPHVEEDLAFSSIAQDEVGHAVVWYRLAAEVAGDRAIRALAPNAPAGGDPVDALALGREPDGYRHAVIVERPNGDWAYTIARQYLYDTADDVRLAVLADSGDPAIAAATGALRREERYHLLHARTWLDRLARGPVEARSHLVRGLAAALEDAGGLFETGPTDAELVTAGVLPLSAADQHARWLEAITGELAALDLEQVLSGVGTAPDGEVVATASGELVVDDARAAPASQTPGGLGGRFGHHSPDFIAVWEEMTGTYRAHPGARW